MTIRYLAAVLHGPRDLRVEERVLPDLGPTDVLVRVRAAGICGSDIKYWTTGKAGIYEMRSPFVLGHEGAGEVVAVGGAATEPRLGARVAINPGRACRDCKFCLTGQSNLCTDMRFLGSASTVPPVDGLMSELVVVDARQCHPLPVSMSWLDAALVEPTAVAVHAAQRFGQVLGSRALVLGAGPIGLLLVQVLRAAGAARIAVSDLLDDRCRRALNCGADQAYPANGSETRDMLRTEAFDVVFEMSGAPAAHALALDVVRRGGTVVQVGSLPAHAIEIPGAALMSKELNILGSFRFASAFDTALRLVASGRLRPAALESQQFDLVQAAEAIECATSAEALKVHITI